jgi:hypothetical protein
MIITEIKRYRTEDGKEHDTMQAAQQWVKREEIVESMYKTTALDRHHCEEAVDWFLENYGLPGDKP